MPTAAVRVVTVAAREYAGAVPATPHDQRLGQTQSALLQMLLPLVHSPPHQPPKRVQASKNTTR